MEPRLAEYSLAQPLARAQIWREVWKIMESEMKETQVAEWSDRKEVKLVARADVKRHRRLSDFRAYHAYMNPSARRTGAQEFRILVDSLQDGSLWRACQQLVGHFQGGASYSAVPDAMREHGVTLWKHGAYNCIRLARWLFQAEGVHANWTPEDWRILSNMGEGVSRGMQLCGLSTYEEALETCQLISSASDQYYTMDSLASFLCLGSRCPAPASGGVKWPRRAMPVTISDDLGIDMDTSSHVHVMHVPSSCIPEPSKTWKRLRIAAPGALDIQHERLLVRRAVIVCLDIQAHFALRQCGRRICLGGAVPQPLARDEQLRDWAARFLHTDGPRAVELQRLGVSRGCLTRALARVWDWLDRLERAVLHSLWRDPLLGALVVVRLATKSEVPGVYKEEVLRLYRSGQWARQREVLILERKVASVLPDWGWEAGV